MAQPYPSYQGVIKPKGLEGLKGLTSWWELSQEDRDSWLNAYPNMKNYNAEDQATLYRNKNYYDVLGPEIYDAYDIPTLDKLYRDKVVNDAVDSYYGKDNDFLSIKELSTEGKLEAFDLGLLNTEDNNRYKEESYAQYEKSMREAAKWMPGGAPVSATSLQSKDEYFADLESKRRSVRDAIIARDNKRKTAESSEEIDALNNFYIEGQNNWGKAYEQFTNAIENGGDLDEVLDSMVGNLIITPEQGMALLDSPIEEKVNLMGELFQKSEFNPSRVGQMFDSVALPQSYSVKSEFGEVEDYQTPGSRTYNQLRSTDKFSNFGPSDKLREYVTWQVLANKYGTLSAISNLETSMMEYAKSQEDFGDWVSDVYLNVTLGGVANIMNKVNAVGNLVTEAKYGSDGLANKLQGKNADGSERKQTENGNVFNWFADNWDNPLYWSKVDEYNTLDPLLIQEIDANGGISPFTTIKLPDAPIKFWSKETLAEALKMAKFAWSDYLTNSLMLGPLARITTAGATKINPGFGSFVNKATGLGVLAGSTLGISESYGVSTFEQAYQQMMESLDSARAETAEQYVQALMNSEEGKAQIDAVVDRLMKQQQEINAGNERGMFVSEKDIRAQVEADFMNYHLQQYNNSDAAITSKEQDERLAKRAAANAYMVDATIEQLRMMSNTAMFRSYILDRGTQRALGMNKGVNAYSQVKEAANGELSLANKALSTARAVANPVIGGFTSNYFDDVTVGFGKGFGLGQYDNYLAKKYNPETDLQAFDFTLNFIDGLGEGISGATEALFDRQSFYDGFIGALGTPFSLTPRLTRAERDAALKTVGKQRGEKLTPMEWMQVHTMNPLVEAYYSEKEKQRNTDKALPVLNKVIADNRDKLENIKSAVIGLNDLGRANTQESELERKDAKDGIAFELAMLLSGASSAPIIGESTTVQEAAEKVSQLASGEISAQDVTDFFNIPENRELAKDSNAEKIARDRIQKNAKSLIKMTQRLAEANDVLQTNSYGITLDKDLKESLLYNMVMRGSWEDRQAEMEKTISGRNKVSNSSNPIAAYGNAKEYERQLAAQTKMMSELKLSFVRENSMLHRLADTYKTLQNSEEATPETLETAQNAVLSAQLSVQTIQEAMREARATLKQMGRDGKYFTEGSEISVLSAEDIISLGPKDRATILDSKNRDNYSEEQQAQIDKAWGILNEKSLGAEALIKDINTLQDRIDRSREAYRRFTQNPDAASAFITTVVQNRAKQTKYVMDLRRVDQTYKAFDAATSNEELVSLAKEALNSKDFNISSEHLSSYIKAHPDKSEALSGLLDVSKVRDAAYYATKKVIQTPKAVSELQTKIMELTSDSNNEAEAMSALEELYDSQPTADAKLQMDRVLETIKTLGHQRDATKVRDRELEREKKREAELKRLEEEAKKDGKNYDWEGYKVGDVVYSKKTGHSGVVVGFEKTPEGVNKMLVRAKSANGDEATIRYDSTKSKDLLTKEAPKPVQEEISATVTEIPEEPPFRDMSKYEQKETLDVPLDSDGAAQSPTAEQQAAAQGTTPISVPKIDPTDQGNAIVETSGTVSGNRWVTYSIDSLKEGVVREEVPDNPKSVFGQIVSWLKSKDINLQDIIDNKFGRILTDNPDVEVQFMTLNPKMHSGLQKVLFPVVKVTDALRQKYNLDSGVIQANGESWLIVGTSGFESSASVEQRTAMDKMRAPINTRRNQYFQNSSEEYYVDPVIKTRVQSTTSGRIVNQGIGAEAPRLKKVSELLSSAGKSLRQGEFGTQTAQAGEKSFATTDNVKDKSKVFPPRNIEDNRGRTFILIETANGNKIPGMIEPAMLNEIAEDSPLRDIIDELLTQLASTNYEVRKEAIRELCGYLVLGEDKNILIGNEKFNALTIKRRGLPDISQELGSKFDLSKFLDDVESANFQINVSLKSLNNPAMLKIYDDSGALMTTVDSMRTAGMSYNLYMTDEHGNIITKTPVTNAKPGTGRTEFKRYRSTRVNNTTYEFKNGQWVNRSNGSKVEPGTALEQSCNYNLEIQESGRSPIFARDNKEYFDMPNGENHYLISRDAFGNVEILDEAAANLIFNALEEARERQARLDALEDVNFEEPTPTPKPQQRREEAPLTPEQIAAQEFGEFTTPQEIAKEQEQPAPQPVKETVREAKETQSTSSKEAVTDMGTKSLEELQKSKNSYTFADVITNADHMDAVYQALEEANLGIDDNTTNAQIEKILKENKIPTVGITNIEDWINIIKCHSKHHSK